MPNRDVADITPDPDYANIWWVQGRGDLYRVEFIKDDGVGQFWSCTCRHGRTHPGKARCYHVRLAQELRDGSD